MYPILCQPGVTPVGHLVLLVGNDVAVLSNGMVYVGWYWDYGPLPDSSQESVVTSQESGIATADR